MVTKMGKPHHSKPTVPSEHSNLVYLARAAAKLSGRCVDEGPLGFLHRHPGAGPSVREHPRAWALRPGSGPAALSPDGAPRSSVRPMAPTRHLPK